jgi:hypothetical protein
MNHSFLLRESRAIVAIYLAFVVRIRYEMIVVGFNIDVFGGGGVVRASTRADWGKLYLGVMPVWESVAGG